MQTSGGRPSKREHAKVLRQEALAVFEEQNGSQFGSIRNKNKSSRREVRKDTREWISYKAERVKKQLY